MKKKSQIYIITILLGIVIVYGVTISIKRSEALKEYGVTEAVIKDFHSCNYSYCLEYKYEVNGKKYSDWVKTEYFKCQDGTEGCLGKKFKIKYSLKSPEISEIDLKEYNVHKLKKIGK